MTFTYFFIILLTYIVWRRGLYLSRLNSVVQTLSRREEKNQTFYDCVDQFPEIILLIPMYEEAEVASSCVYHMHKFSYPKNKLKMVYITTQKEGPLEANDTANTLKNAIRLSGDDRMELIHFPQLNRYRADQMNYVLRNLSKQICADSTYIGVYNADSRPDPDSLMQLGADYVRSRTQNGEGPDAYQQPLRYVVSPRKTTWHPVMATAAAIQTFWTFAKYLPGFLDEQINNRPWWRIIKYAPQSTAGHGEFIRLDILRDIGLFPDYVYADGLLLGWTLSLHKCNIRILTRHDIAEVPSTPSELVIQHTAWFRGLGNVYSVVKHLSKKKSIELSAFYRVFYVAHAVFEPLLWGMRSLSIIVILCFLALNSLWLFLAGIVLIWLFALAPLIILTRSAYRLGPFEGGQNPISLLTILGSLFGLLFDGLGFWRLVFLEAVSCFSPKQRARITRKTAR